MIIKFLLDKKYLDLLVDEDLEARQQVLMAH